MPAGTYEVRVPRYEEVFFTVLADADCKPLEIEDETCQIRGVQLFSDWKQISAKLWLTSTGDEGESPVVHGIAMDRDALEDRVIGAFDPRHGAFIMAAFQEEAELKDGKILLREHSRHRYVSPYDLGRFEITCSVQSFEVRFGGGGDTPKMFAICETQHAEQWRQQAGFMDRREVEVDFERLPSLVRAFFPDDPFMPEYILAEMRAFFGYHGGVIMEVGDEVQAGALAAGGAAG